MHLTVQLIHLLITECSSEMNSMEGWQIIEELN